MMYLLALFSGLYILIAPAPIVTLSLHTYVYPPQQLKLFTFGYNESLADSMWLRVIQDIDVCEKKEIAKGSSAAVPKEAQVCHKGWVFQFLDGITELTPKFRMPYVSGALILSVLVEDREGATVIFEKGLKQFPNDWSLDYKAAYHYLFEEKNEVRAAELMVLAANNGAPPWLRSLAAHLYTKNGKLDLAKSVITEAMDNNPDDVLKARLQKRLHEIEEASASSAN